MTIALKGEQLVGQMSGTGKVPIYAETETKFFTEMPIATIEFCKDDKGAVSHLILRLGGRESTARRVGY